MFQKLFLSPQWPIIRHYIISSVITFITGFVASLVLVIDKFDLVSLRSGAWVGLILVAVRAGIKVVLEKFLESKLVK